MALLLLALPLVAGGAPAVGGVLPDVEARDVTGKSTRLGSLLEDRTIVVAITDRHGDDAMRAWFERADEVAPGAGAVSIVSLDLPFYVSDGTARSKARQQVPREEWSHSLLDKDGKLAKQLGLPEGRTPLVLVVDSGGKVLARYHGKAGDPGAAAVWDALRG